MRRLVSVAAVTLLLTVPAPAAPAVAATPGGTVTWGDCPTADPEVPHDPHPRGASITVTISRIATSVPGQRRGVLLSNPGGPGGSGLDMPGYLAAALPAEVLARYDLIGFDPRGVGTSTPISCGLAADTP